MNTVTVTYFATLREQAGVSDEQFTVDSVSVSDLYRIALEGHGFDVAPRFILYSVNARFVPTETLLSDGDHVVFIPPVSGG